MPTRVETTKHRFRARTDAGAIVTGTETRHTTIFSPISGPEQRVSVISNFELDDHREVERDASGNLTVVETGEIMYIIERL